MSNIRYFRNGQDIIECKFGLKQLNILNQISYDVDRDLKMLWKLGTGLDTIPQSLIGDFKIYLQSLEIPTPDQLNEHYITGLGELSIPLQALEQMTPDELALAYNGYLRRQELTANLSKIAYIQGQANNADYIELNQQSSCSEGSTKEREQIFKELGIKEDNNGYYL